MRDSVEELRGGEVLGVGSFREIREIGAVRRCLLVRLPQQIIRGHHREAMEKPLSFRRGVGGEVNAREVGYGLIVMNGEISVARPNLPTGSVCDQESFEATIARDGKAPLFQERGWGEVKRTRVVNTHDYLVFVGRGSRGGLH